LITSAIREDKLSRIASCDLHAPQIQGFYDGPFDVVDPTPMYRMIMRFLYGKGEKAVLEKMALCATDEGSHKNNKTIADHLGLPRIQVDKDRPADNVAEAKGASSTGIDFRDLKGHWLWVREDMVDTSGSICTSYDIIKPYKPAGMIVTATHPLLSIFYRRVDSGDPDSPVKEIVRPEDRISRRNIQLIFSDTVPKTRHYYKTHAPSFLPLSVAPQFGDLITCNIYGESHGRIMDNDLDFALHATKTQLAERLKMYKLLDTIKDYKPLKRVA
jgi:phosphoribosylpyrophosphate synthetase